MLVFGRVSEDRKISETISRYQWLGKILRKAGAGWIGSTTSLYRTLVDVLTNLEDFGIL